MRVLKGHNETWAEVYKDANKLEIIQQDNKAAKPVVVAEAESKGVG